MNVKDLIAHLEKMPPDADVTVEITPGRPMAMRIDSGIIRPAFVQTESENRGSIMIRRKENEAIIIAQDGVAICRVMMATKRSGVRIFAPRSIEIMREEVAPSRGISYGN